MSAKYEVIFCVVNAGYSSLVMDAAKAEGAGGGTVLHARGTANKEAEKYFNITIQPEKDIVMILVPVGIKEAVLHALYRNVGLNTPGQGIAFSMPVENVVGLSERKPVDKKHETKTEEKPEETAEDKDGKKE